MTWLSRNAGHLALCFRSDWAGGLFLDSISQPLLKRRQRSFKAIASPLWDVMQSQAQLSAQTQATTQTRLQPTGNTIHTVHAVHTALPLNLPELPSV